MDEETDSPARAQNPQHAYLEIVAALSEENSKLLFSRQRASGVEIEVLAAERTVAETADPGKNGTDLARLYELDRLAKLELETVERRIEDLESRMTAILVRLQADRNDREMP